MTFVLQQSKPQFYIMKTVNHYLIHLCLCILILFISTSINAQENNSTLQNVDRKEYEIGGIKVTGNQSSNKQTIISISGLKIGGKITIPGNTIPNASKALWKMKLFTDVEIYKEKTVGDIIFLEINVVERAQLSDYSIHGVKKINEKDIENILDKHLEKGAIVTKNDEINATVDIRKYYEEKGYLNAEVSISETPKNRNSNQVNIEVSVQRGKKVKIENIFFVGNKNVSSQKLRKEMQATKMKKDIFSPSKYLQDGYKLDKANIISYYNTLGYRDATIISDSISENINGHLNIRIEIEEGQRYFHRNIVIKGNSIYSTEELMHLLNIKQGDAYNTRLLDTRLHYSPEGRDISTQYLDNGYLFFRVEAIETAIVNNQVDLELKIFEGTQATINKVTINGNDRTSEEVIRRELRTKPGQKFSRSAIVRSQRELINMGYFNPESLGINTSVNPKESTVDIEYVVEEKSSAKMELSGGYTPGIGVTGTLGFTVNNFSLRKLKDPSSWKPFPTGDGQQLSIRAQSDGSSYQTYNLAFTEPWLGGKKPMALSIGGSFSRLASSDLNDNGNFQKLSTGNAYVGLGTRLKWPDDNWVSSTRLNYKVIKLQDWQGGQFELDDGSFLTDGLYHNLSLQQTFSRSTVNHPFFPTSGSNISLSMQFTPPYSLFNKNSTDSNKSAEDKFKYLEYHKWRFTAETYKKVAGKLTLKASAKLGMLGRYNSNASLSPFDRFVLGGDAFAGQQGGLLGFDQISMRGYDIGDFSTSGNGGAGVFNKYTVELRYPLLQNSPAQIYGLAFFEAGNAFDSIKNYNPLDLKYAAGIGFRAQVPILGTIGVDYGLGFNKDRIPGANIFQNYGQFSIILGVELE